ncbi:MAG: hypothetical protein A2725_00280 [Candidatus Magasanikbacteria bacterium RIFCSPHIGHO2_01_FULL_33_34]|uniref:Uncharacterized protein n=1 Tax=Candidatus Magasanikbacteria bacterium RIFCSPHIGHO2_01_FULL_33_34 TaxID=1798671 RepID=A0A1F6LLA5_9BACT|nr:MAG: hypothetical protein A2725_00280 [Candidatus Magasanikbacteria bacterium RIFCSPHIGHO2_01_FULL_33_34]OGH65798.1 MAG: hypothetical protein A3B83_02950 [Candidatus Magasanikbacteria bacterium RIFCSPHIGHO2_02_FULL_33_17]OGH75163.1 MAG: hypothetical protein A3A89_03545 [Candidatus Magasanikbacteria bacterium RIFCSPLOWO2_01_FULL_33_34]
MVKRPVKKEKNENSFLRILGAAFFGFLLGSISRIIVSFSTPNILMRINDTSFDEARLLASSSFLSNMVVGAFIIFFTSAVAGFLAKRRGVLVGLLSNLLPIGFWLLAFLYALMAGAHPIRLIFSIPFLQFVIVVVTCIFGGLYGEAYYKKERDLDLDKHGSTIFGVYWAHYLWITPFVFFPFVSAVLAIIYSWLYTFSTDLYFISNFKLWISLAWWFYFFINPLIILGSGIIVVIAFQKFWQVMQFRQTYYDTWEKGGKILLYGIATPVIVKLIVTFTINSTKNMSHSVIGDWKLIMFILVIPVIGILLKGLWWLKDSLTVGVVEKKIK